MSWQIDAISGTWHLVDPAADEVNIPQHRMDLRLVHGPDGVRGAVLNRVTGEEMPVVRTASFDGERLQIEMISTMQHALAEVPTLIMTVDGTRLLGHWYQQNVPVGPRLKLVRARG